MTSNEVTRRDMLTVAAVGTGALVGGSFPTEPASAAEPAKLLRPANPEALGFFHLLLRQAGAVQRADGYELSGRSIRVINGAQSILATLRRKFVEPPAATQTDIVVAVGATDLGVPDNVVRSGRAGDVTDHPVTKDVIVVGRTAGRADLIVRDPVISRVQCRFIFRNGEVEVEDMGSSCGTMVLGHKIQRTTLRWGDVVRVGDSELEIVRQ